MFIMKKYIALVSQFLCAFCAFGQLELEHTYPNGILKREILDVSGEKYSLTTYGTWNSVSLKVYNADHSDSGITLTLLPPGLQSYLGVAHLSENIFDNDPKIEALLGWTYDGEDVFGMCLVQESGDRKELCTSATMKLLEGFTPRLFCSNKVYDLPSFQLLHSFSNIGCYSGCYSDRIYLPIGGELYLIKPGNSSSLYVYDGVFNLVKTVTLPFFNAQNNLSQTFFNDDALFEFCGIESIVQDEKGNNKFFKIVREDGVLLFSEKCVNAYIAGLSPQKLVVRKFTAPAQLVTEVLDAKTFEHLFTLDGGFDLFVADDAKEFYRTALTGNHSFVLFEPVNMALKTVHLPYPLKQNSPIQYAVNKLSSGGKLELIYSALTNPNETKVVWTNEDGQVLRVFEGAKLNVSIDKTGGFEPKLLVKYGSFPYDSTQVYRFLKTNTGILPYSSQLEVITFPNPFADQIEINLPYQGNFELNLMNASGQSILRKKVNMDSKSVLFPPFTLPQGIYILHVQGEAGTTSIKLSK
jgi:hypothetical protein